MADGVVYAEIPPMAKPSASVFSQPFRLPGQRLLHRGDRTAGCSASTARTAPARPATAWGWKIVLRSRIWSCRTNGSRLADGAVAPWSGSQSPYYDQTLQSLARSTSRSPRAPPGHELPDRGAENAILFGTGNQCRSSFAYKDGVRSLHRHQTVRRRDAKTCERRLARKPTAPGCARRLSRYQAEKPCAVCNGAQAEAGGAGGKGCGQQEHRGCLGHFPSAKRCPGSKACWKR